MAPNGFTKEDMRETRAPIAANVQRGGHRRKKRPTNSRGQSMRLGEGTDTDAGSQTPSPPTLRKASLE